MGSAVDVLYFCAANFIKYILMQSYNSGCFVACSFCIIMGSTSAGCSHSVFNDNLSIILLLTSCGHNLFILLYVYLICYSNTTGRLLTLHHLPYISWYVKFTVIIITTTTSDKHVITWYCHWYYVSLDVYSLM